MGADVRGRLKQQSLPFVAGRQASRCTPLDAWNGLRQKFNLGTLLVLTALTLFALSVSPAAAQGLPPPIEGLGNVPVWIPPSREGELPVIEVPSARSTVPPNADEIRFTPSSIDISGATALSERELSRMTRPFVGREVALSELYGLAAELQTTYRERGYLLTRALVPAQRIENGAFRIEVIEGFFEDVFVVGDIGPSKWQVEQYVDNLTRMRPVRTQDIERYLLLSNDLPGIKAVAVIRPGTSGPGAAQLIVEVERDPFDGFVSVNNRGSNYAGPWAGALGIGMNGFAPFGDRTEIIYFRALDGREAVYNNAGDEIVSSLPTEQWYGQVSYEGSLLDEGLRLLLTATQTLSHPGYTLAPIDIKTRVDRYSAYLSYPFIRTRSRSVYGHIELSHSMQRSTAIGQSIGRDRLTVVEVGAGMDFEDVIPRWLLPFDFLAAAESHVDVSVRQGLPFFGATSDADLSKSRLDGTAQFTTFQARLERTQGVFNRFDLYLGAAGQYSLDTLLSPEEFRVGGDEFGRGYNPSEISGEHGIGATAELRYHDRPSLWMLEAYEAYVFYDYGLVWNEDDGFAPRSDLASAGLGARTEIGEDTYFDVELARTLTRILGSRNTPEDTWRLLVRATVQF